jgi:hypothetical protein
MLFMVQIQTKMQVSKAHFSLLVQSSFKTNLRKIKGRLHSSGSRPFIF